MTLHTLNIVEANTVLQAVKLTMELLRVPGTSQSEHDLMISTLAGLMARLDLFDHYFQRLEERLTATPTVCEAAE